MACDRTATGATVRPEDRDGDLGVPFGTCVIPPTIIEGPNPPEFEGIRNGRRCCEWCGQPFKSKTRRRRHCLPDCRVYHWRWRKGSTGNNPVTTP